MTIQRYLRPFLILLCLLFAFSFLEKTNSSNRYILGVSDFMQYWAAVQAADSGKNPYDSSIVIEIERQIDPSLKKAVMMWNPPWLLLVLKPFCTGSFETSVSLWLAANIVFLLASLFFLIGFFDNGKAVFSSFSKAVVFLAATFSFYPAWNNISSGQSGLLLTFGLSLFLWADKKKYLFFAGAALTILTVKPHLFYLIWIMIVYKSAKTDPRLLLNFLGIFVAAVGLTEILYSGINLEWFTSLNKQQHAQNFIPISEWRSETLVAWLRTLSLDFLGVRSDWLMWALPLSVGIIYTASLLIKCPKVGYQFDLPTLLCISVFSSAYGWCSDFSVLMIPYAALLIRSLLATNLWAKSAAYLALAINTSFFIYSFYEQQSHSYVFLTPVIVLVLYYLSAFTNTRQSSLS